MGLKKTFVITSLGGLLMFYQNCSLSGEHSSTQSSFAKTCSEPMQLAYKQTYYPIFRTSCAGCHEMGGESGRYFASSDFGTAYSSFASIGRKTIETQALSTNHKPPYTGPQHTGMIESAKASFSEAEQAVTDCMFPNQVVTSAKSNAAIYTATPNDATAWPRVTYNLMTEVQRASLVNKISLEVSIEVRRYRVNNVDTGYEFRNPRVKVLDDGNTATPLPKYHISGLHIHLNGSLISNFTLFGALDADATTATDTLMMPGVGYSFVLATPANSDTFSLQFDAIMDGTGAPIGGGGGGGGGGGSVPTYISYNMLASTAPLTGVFGRTCFRCHNSTQASGGLNLQDYNAARANSATIRSRMNDFGNPMPPNSAGGPLSINERTVIDNWISSGTPQN